MAYQDGSGNDRVEPRFDSINDPGARFRPEADKPRASIRGKLLGALVALAAVAGFVGIAWYATTQGQKDSSVVVPMIRADNSPIKVLPEKPGGMEVANQDKLIFMQVTPDQKKSQVERLLPPPEKPMAKPSPPPKPIAAEPPKPQDLKSETLVSDAAALPPRAPVRPEPVPPEAQAVPKVLPTQPKTAELAPEAVAAIAEPAKPAPEAKDMEKAAAPSEQKPQPQPAAKEGFLVQLGALKAEDGASKEAARLTKRHKALLEGLTVKAVRADLGKRGVFYRLRAGPLTDRAAASNLCDKLKARKQGCMIINP